jgi:hypothetical protein
MKRSILVVGLILFSLSIYGQTAIPVASSARAHKTYLNKQGFELSASIPDTCRVYKGAKGGLFVYRISKKTGQTYKSYLPKPDSTNLKK